MPKKSAGLLIYRIKNNSLEFFLVHPGGPFWANKDAGSWSIPKGEYAQDEDPLTAAKREFAEETGFIATGRFIPLTSIKQAGGKIVSAWALKSDFDEKAIKSNLFSMEWPPKSGHVQQFPEIDRAGWFTLEQAKEKIIKAQFPLVQELCSEMEDKPAD